MPNPIKSVDITPTPRVLRVLGELPFAPWQCFAELIDNSVDAFNKAEECEDRRIDILWASERVAQDERTIEIKDNGPGMTIEQITNAVKAGYTSNDPVDNLGLFGLGFNIATAKLGDKTIVYSTRNGDSEWVGVEIDFAQLNRNRTFNAPVLYLEKEDVTEHGTRIVISNLNNGVYTTVKSKESAIRKQLENVYAHLIAKQAVDIYIQNKRLSAKKYCVWSKSRYVIRDGVRIYAIQDIDRVLGSSFFDSEKNCYLTADQEDELQVKLNNGESLPSHIIRRQKRLKGWVGIQRYFDTNDFGIDFIRNGRKILLSNKEAFSFENEFTGTSILQYPVELGTTVGGRIVGEIEVDFLIPTYQKNDFDRTDISWKQTLEALRGIGPILPKLRKAMGYESANTSPIGLLANAYRRPDVGTKNLSLARNIATEFLTYFQQGNPDYIEDDRWWQAVVESDRNNASANADQAGEVDSGNDPSDDPANYIPGDANVVTTPPSTSSEPTTTPNPPITSSMDWLLQNSAEQASLSRKYTYGHQMPFNVKVHKMKRGQKIYVDGISIPCLFTSDSIDCDFFFDDSHEIIAQFPNTPESMLLYHLARKFASRDSANEMMIYSKLMAENFPEKRIDKASLKEQAELIFEDLREKLAKHLEIRYGEVLSCIKKSSGETEETMSSILSNPELYQAFNLGTSEGIAVINYVPVKTIIRLVSTFPEYLFDDRVFSALYSRINHTDPNVVMRLRDESRDRVVSLLKDAQIILGGQTAHSLTKDELSRFSLSLNILKGVIL